MRDRKPCAITDHSNLNIRHPQVAFDGRVLEIFGADVASSRFHIAQLDAPESVETADGARLLSLGDGSVTLSFAREEAPACDRLVAAIAEARA